MSRLRPPSIAGYRLSLVKQDQRTIALSVFGRWLAVAGLIALFSACSTESSAPNSAESQSSPPQPSDLHANHDADETESVHPKTVRNLGRSSVSLNPTKSLETGVDRLARLAEPHRDDWGTEHITRDASKNLKLLAELIETGQLEDHQLATVMASDVACRYPTDESLESAHRDSIFSVRRAKPLESIDSADQVTVSGFDGFRTLVSNWQRTASASSLSVHFKVYRVTSEAGQIRTRAYVEISHRSAHSAGQRTLECECHWRPSDNSLLLTELSINQAELTSASIEQGRLFEDCTRSVLARNHAYRQQVVPGIPYWSRRIGREHMGQFGHHGLAIADVNGDDLDDLYVCDTGGLPNRLYIQQLDGTVEDASAASGINLLEESRGVLLVDLDNDGDQDLTVVTDPWIQFAENDGTGRFELRDPVGVDTDGYSLSAADFDQDGDVDIYVCGYNARRQEASSRGLPFPLPYHDANNGGRNYLLRNDGDFRFVDATSDVGLDVDNRRFSLAAAWQDYDNDGDQDLYVANDFGRNCLYENRTGRFVNVASFAGVEDHASGMSVSWGDYDRDGLMDIYVSNMFSAAGNRVTYQRRFREGLSEKTVANVQRMARGNTLFRNQGDGTFADTSVAANATQGRWAWGSRFVDFNNDGWQDLFVANGYVTNEDTSDL